MDRDFGLSTPNFSARMAPPPTLQFTYSAYTHSCLTSLARLARFISGRTGRTALNVCVQLT